jgi:hypothetical protein
VTRSCNPARSLFETFKYPDHVIREAHRNLQLPGFNVNELYFEVL